MNKHDLSPLPGRDEKGAQACARIHPYLAIVDELSTEQAYALSEHLTRCTQCARAFQHIQQANRLIATLPESRPSARVDATILTALQQRQRTTAVSAQIHMHAPGRRRSSRLTWTLVAASLLVITAGILLRGLLVGGGAGFRLPPTLSWHGYVLHYIQTRDSSQGQSYQVEVYQDLGTNNMHVESQLPGQFDVVVVSDKATMLGKDMMHHIAQMGSGVAGWMTDGSLFDLDLLRHDLATGNATYLGIGRFQGQKVHQLRMDNGQILLLNMDYLPVNALRNFHGQGTGTLVYRTCQLLLSAQVSDSLWDMQVPSDFQMGPLPTSS
jgi:hypothetical protein